MDRRTETALRRALLTGVPWERERSTVRGWREGVTRAGREVMVRTELSSGGFNSFQTALPLLHQLLSAPEVSQSDPSRAVLALAVGFEAMSRS